MLSSNVFWQCEDGWCQCFPQGNVCVLWRNWAAETAQHAADGARDLAVRARVFVSLSLQQFFDTVGLGGRWERITGFYGPLLQGCVSCQETWLGLCMLGTGTWVRSCCGAALQDTWLSRWWASLWVETDEPGFSEKLAAALKVAATWPGKTHRAVKRWWTAGAPIGPLCAPECWSRSCGCLETSRSTNRNFLYATNGLYLVLAVVLIAMAHRGLAAPWEELQLFSDLAVLISAVRCMGWLLLLTVAVGVLGAHRRHKMGVVMFLSLSAIFLLLEVVFAGVLFYWTRPLRFDERQSELYLDNWLQLVSKAQRDEGVYRWFQSLFEEEQCCGWLDVSDAQQNPLFLGCSVPQPVPCSQPYRAQLGLAQAVAIVGIIFSVIQFLLLTISCGLLCRPKKYYHPVVYSYGDWWEEDDASK